MRRNKKKIDTCPNCGFELQKEYNYCPNCGQENHLFQLSFGHLVRDFFDNYFSFDSRFGRSIRPFFLNPGKLTSAFVEGKRMMYANPVRLYLVISLIHFFILSLSFSQNDTDEEKRGGIIKINESDKNQGPVQFNFSDNKDSLDTEDNGWPLTAKELLLVKEMLADGKHSKKEVLDSLHVEDRSFFQGHVIRQIVKMQDTNEGNIREMILKNIPILMFFLLPLYALILKIFFRRRLYIHHLIHSVHIHCFTFLVLSVLWFVIIFSESLVESIFLYAFLLIIFYVVVSFRSTYEIRWRTSVFKVVFSGMLYMVVLAVGLLTEILLSFLFY